MISLGDLLADAVSNTPPTYPWWMVATMFIGAIGGVGGLIALLTLTQTKRKMTADTGNVVARTDTEKANAGVIISNAALAQMTNAMDMYNTVRAELLEVKADNEKLDSRVEELESEHRRYIRNAEEHKRWDNEMVAEVRKLGGMASDPPPLFPLGAA